MFKPLNGHPQGAQLLHSSSNFNKMSRQL